MLHSINFGKFRINPALRIIRFNGISKFDCIELDIVFNQKEYFKNYVC